MPKEARLDLASLPIPAQGQLEVLTDGSVRIPAVIARTGIQVYQYEDGREVREYRPADEVFLPASMDTWKGLSLTMGHPDKPVDPSNWFDSSVGHIGDSVRANGRFLCADAVVKADEAIQAIATGDLVEVSCGYFAEIDPTPGVTPEGEPYDQIQRAIVGNHVALGPKGWGRAGSEVRLMVGDSADSPRVRRAVAYHSDTMAMVKKTQTNKRAKKDEGDNTPKPDSETTKDADTITCPNCGADCPAGAEKCDACGAALTKDADTEEKAPDSEATKDEGEGPSAEDFARLQAENDALKAQLEALMAQLEANKKTEDSRLAKRIDLRVKALKADSSLVLVDDKGRPLSDRELMVKVIKGKDPKFDAKDKDEAYLRARFDLTCEGFGPSAARPNAQALANTLTRSDSAQETDLAVIARNRMLERNRSLADKTKAPIKSTK